MPASPNRKAKATRKATPKSSSKGRKRPDQKTPEKKKPAKKTSDKKATDRRKNKDKPDQSKARKGSKGNKHLEGEETDKMNHWMKRWTSLQISDRSETQEPDTAEPLAEEVAEQHRIWQATLGCKKGKKGRVLHSSYGDE